jgi:sensor histidine kinase YesM
LRFQYNIKKHQTQQKQLLTLQKLPFTQIALFVSKFIIKIEMVFSRFKMIFTQIKYLLLCCFVGLGAAFGQLPPTIEIDKPLSNDEVKKINGFYSTFEDNSSPKMTFQQVVKQHFKLRLEEEFSASSPHSITWVYFKIKNTNPTDTLKALYYGGGHISLSIFSIDQKGVVKQTDNDFQVGRITYQHKTFRRFSLPITILPQSEQTFIVRQECLFYYTKFAPVLYNDQQYEYRRNNKLFSQRASFAFLWLLVGICLFLCIFSFSQFVFFKNNTSLWWGIYLGINGVFFLMVSDIVLNVPIIPISVYDLFVHVEYLIIISYLLFFNSFLDLKQHSPVLYKAVKYMIGFVSAICLLGIYLIFSQPAIGYVFYDYAFYVTQVLFYGLFIVTALTKIPNKKLLLAGSLLLAVFALYAVIVSQLGKANANDLWQTPTLIYGMGVFVELIFVSLALSQRNRQIEAAKQLLEKEKEFEAKRMVDITNSFKQQIAQTEIAALRAQMNPHFIFNCLNSIQYFTAKNDSESASNYLSKFSKLIRLVLENSRSEKVTLQNELETLRLYIEMEAMRFQNKLSYRLNINQDIDQDYIQIPPLLLQPFVENAIWHGLMHKEEGGTIVIDVTTDDFKSLHITITDDGIGRQKAAEFKSKTATKNKSFGMKVTAERIELINQLYKTETQIQIIDLKNADGFGVGTKVIIEIPI